jgi:hypothetical protein
MVVLATATRNETIIYGQFFSITTSGHSINPTEALEQEKLLGIYCNHHNGTKNIKRNIYVTHSFSRYYKLSV